MKYVAVTGAAGYIGGQTCIELKSHGYRIIGVDLRPLPDHLRSFVDHFVNKNVSDAADIIADVDGIVHCAGTSLVGPSVTNPALYYQNNVGATSRMIEVLSWNSWRGRFVFSSSAAVYGNPKTMPIGEIQAPSPINVYGKSKLYCEELIADSARAYKFSAVSLRYFNACGADLKGRHGQEPKATHIFPRIFEAVKNNQPIEIYGNDYVTDDGTCVRDYVHVVDLATAHRLALEKPLPVGHSVFNLGTKRGYSVLEIVQETQKVLGQTNEVVIKPRRLGDPAVLIANAEHFKNYFEWEPDHSNLPAIIRSLKKWYHV